MQSDTTQGLFPHRFVCEDGESSITAFAAPVEHGQAPQERAVEILARRQIEYDICPVLDCATNEVPYGRTLTRRATACDSKQVAKCRAMDRLGTMLAHPLSS